MELTARAVIRPVVCFSSEAWDAPLLTNRQRVMGELSRLGHPILFVETDGWFPGRLLRALKLGRAPSSAYRTSSVAGTNVTVYRCLNVAPLSWRLGAAMRLNARIEARRLRRAIELKLTGKPVLWLYDPRAVVIAERLPSLAIVYDCVDDYAEQVPPSAQKLVSVLDKRSTSAATVVFTTSRSLYARKKHLNDATHYIPNVADFTHFASGRTHPVPTALQGLDAPVIGFAGSIVSLKVDVELLADLARARPSWTFVLVGPVERDIAKQLSVLSREPNVVAIGSVPYANLPAYVAAFDVCLIPYRGNAYTRGVFPLKLYEYLAAGAPVVATGVPSIPVVEPDIFVADGAAEVVRAIEIALRHRAQEDVERRQGLAAGHTWEDRVSGMLGALKSSGVPA